MKTLIIGAGGQVGSKLVDQTKNKFETYATYQTRMPSLDKSRTFQVDKTSRETISNLFQKLKPNVVIDTAALHNVDYCENHKNEAWTVNFEGTKNVAEACAKSGARMIFISTDFVFDGTRGNYNEDDDVNPVNYYGITKLEAEKMIAQTLSDYVVARPSVIYGYVSTAQRQSSSGKPLNFAMWLTQKLSKNESLRIVTDQYSSPTLADSLAETLLKLAQSDRTGIYHTAGATRLSRYEFATKLAWKLNLDEKLITPIMTNELKQLAKRPMDSSLSVSKIEKDLNIKMHSVDEALDRFKTQYLSAER